jgi:hypothetical protein
MNDATKTYQGLLSIQPHGEYDEALYISSVDAPLADELAWIAGKIVTVRYWITDKPCTKDEAQEAAILQIMGLADVDFGARYSEATGYLWTDEELNIGGHDLLAELKSNVGKWCILEIEIGRVSQ